MKNDNHALKSKAYDLFFFLSPNFLKTIRYILPVFLSFSVLFAQRLGDPYQIGEEEACGFSDEFNGDKLNEKWLVLGRPPANIRLHENGRLRVKAPAGSVVYALFNDHFQTAPRLLQAVDPEKDWTVITQASINFKAGEQGLGILGVIDPNPASRRMVRLADFSRLANGSKKVQGFIYPQDAPQGLSLPYAGRTVYLKVVKTGEVLEAFFSADGEVYSSLGVAGQSNLSKVHYLGLYTVNPRNPAPNVIGWFDFFRISGCETDPCEENNSASLRDGLKAYFPFDDHYRDVSGAGYNGQAAGEPTFSEGRKNASLYFDGQDDHVSLGNEFQLSNTFTVSAWIKWEKTRHMWNTIFSKHETPGAGPFVFAVRNKRFNFWMTSETGLKTNFNSNHILQEGEWTHVVFEGENNTGRIFVNGVLDAEHPIPDMRLSGDLVAVGRQTRPLPGVHQRDFKGNIDELTIYDRVLTADEKRALYNGCFDPPDCSGFSVSAAATPASNGLADGTATATPSGGVGEIFYEWNTSPVQTTQTAVDLPVGTYQVTVKDENGCTASAEVEVKTGAVLTYELKNDFAADGPGAPALDQLGEGEFVNSSLGDLGCESETVYHFDFNSGLSFDNAASDFIDETYSIELLFKFENLSGWKRIIDYKNRTSDTGVYIKDGKVSFYNEVIDPEVSFSANEYAHFIITRNSADNKLLSMYVNGQMINSFVDETDLAVLSADNILRFFQDDLVVNNEASAGEVALIRLYNYALSATQVEDVFKQLECKDGETSLSITINMLSAPACQGDCNGEAAIRISGGKAPFSYEWSTGDDGETVGDLCVGGYSATVTDANGTKASASLIIAEPNLLTISADITEASCAAAARLIARADGGTAPYQFHLNCETNTDGLFSGLAPGEYLLTVVDAHACANVVPVEIKAGEVALFAEFGFSSSFLTASFTDQSLGNPTSWSWTFGDGAVSTQQNPSHTYDAEGHYEVCLTVSNACGQETSCQEIIVQEAVGHSRIAAPRTRAYPNPAQEVVHFEFVATNKGDFSLSLTDLNGKTLRSFFRKRSLAAGSQYERLEVGDLPAGMYYLRLQWAEEFWVEKIVLGANGRD